VAGLQVVRLAFSIQDSAFSIQLGEGQGQGMSAPAADPTQIDHRPAVAVILPRRATQTRTSAPTPSLSGRFPVAQQRKSTTAGHRWSIRVDAEAAPAL
jgi:hypothetical protein